MGDVPDLSNFSKFFSYRYRISEQTYKKAALLDSVFSYKEFLKISGHWMEENTRNRLHAAYDGVDVDEDALLAYYDEKTKKVVYKDIYNKYKFNSSGYRMPQEITGTEDVIFAGCSHSVGEGIPEEAVWGVQVANQLGLSWANLSVAGRSTSWAVETIFGYLSRYSAKPKVIALLLPELDRFQVVNNPLSLISKFSGDNKKDVIGHGLTVGNHFGAYFNTNPKISERPHWAEDVLNSETLFMYSMRAIKSLAMYCKAAGIKFVWSTWCAEDYWILDQYREELGISEEFVQIEPTKWYCSAENGWRDELHTGEYFIPELDATKGHESLVEHTLKNCTTDENPNCSVLTCHQELEDKYGWNFHIATDKHETPEHSHFGIHKHTHFAEKFLSAITSEATDV